jgi:hypothetical protein
MSNIESIADAPSNAQPTGFQTLAAPTVKALAPKIPDPSAPVTLPNVDTILNHVIDAFKPTPNPAPAAPFAHPCKHLS